MIIGIPKEIKSGEAFPDIPLIVIARDEELSAKPYIEHGIPEAEAVLHERVWRELQVELAGLSNIGELVIAEASDHEVHKDQPGVIVESLERLGRRAARDIYETREKLERLITRYNEVIALLEERGQPIVKLDATASIDALSQQIWDRVTALPASRTSS